MTVIPGPHKPILFLGGPIHGEVKGYNIHPYSDTISVPSLKDPIVFAPEIKPPELTTYNTHIYKRKRDLEELIPQYQVFEHESLCDENVERRAARLDQEIDVYPGPYPEPENLDKYKKLKEERDEITREWGI